MQFYRLASNYDVSCVQTNAPQASTADGGSAAGDAGGDGEQWAYVPTTTVSAEIMVERVDSEGAHSLSTPINRHHFRMEGLQSAL